MMPALTTAPLSTAEAGIGATGCASGSQTCSGTSPAFSPNPAISSPTAKPRAGEPGSAATRIGDGEARPLHHVGQQREAEQQADLAHHREEERDLAGPPGPRRAVLHDEAEGG